MDSDPTLHEGLTPTPQDLEPLLQELGILQLAEPRLADEQEVRAALAFGRSLASSNPDAGAALLAVVAAVAVEEGMPPEIWSLAIRDVAATGRPVAVWYLRELAHWPGGGAIEREAQALFVDLHLSNIPPEPPAHDRLHSGMISAFDGAGTRRLALFFRSEDNQVRGLDLAIHDEKGITEVVFKADDASSTELQLQHAALMWAQCDITLAREVLGDALAIHGERKVPPQGAMLLYRHFFGAPPIDMRPREPDLNAFRLDQVRPHPDMVEGSEAMVSYPPFARLTFRSDDAYRCVRDRLLGDRTRSGAHAISRTFLRDFARMVQPAEQHVLVRRLAANLEVEALMGDAKKPLNRIAALTWLALKRDVVPFEEIPYVQALCDRSISEIAKTVGDRFAEDDLALEDLDLEDEMDQLAAAALEEYETDPGGEDVEADDVELKEISSADFEEHETEPGLDDDDPPTEPGLD